MSKTVITLLIGESSVHETILEFFFLPRSSLIYKTKRKKTAAAQNWHAVLCISSLKNYKTIPLITNRVLSRSFVSPIVLET